jgi:hypothetical protein
MAAAMPTAMKNPVMPLMPGFCPDLQGTRRPALAALVAVSKGHVH